MVGAVQELEQQFEVALSHMLTDEQVLVWEYDAEGYEGRAFVLYQTEAGLFEVHGAHCSCYGLEGQWEPEATTWEALALRGDAWCWYWAKLEPLVSAQLK